MEIKQRQEEFLESKRRREEAGQLQWAVSQLTGIRKMEFERLVRNEGMEPRKALEKVGFLLLKNQLT